MWTSGPRFGRCCQPLWLASARGIYGTKPVIKWNRKGFGTCSWKTNPSHFKTGNLVPWNALFFHDVVLMIKIHNLLFEHHILIHIHSFYQPFCYMCPDEQGCPCEKTGNEPCSHPNRVSEGLQQPHQCLQRYTWGTAPRPCMEDHSIHSTNCLKGPLNSPCSAMPYVFVLLHHFK